MGQIELVSAPAAFPTRLAAWSDPTFVGRSIASGRRLDAPSGIIELDTPERRGPTVVSRSLAQPMDLAARPGPVGGRTAATAALDEAFATDEPAAPGTDVTDADVTNTASTNTDVTNSDLTNTDVPAEALPVPATGPDAVGGTEVPAPRGMAAPSAPSAPPFPTDGPPHTGTVRRTAQRIESSAAPIATGPSRSTGPVRGVSASMPVQRRSGPASDPVPHAAPARAESPSPVVPRGQLPGPEDGRTQSSTVPEPVAEIVSEPPTPPDRPSSTLPVLQRARLHPVSEGEARVMRGPDPVEATEVPLRQSSPRAGAQVVGSVAPGVLQRASALPRAVPSVGSGSPLVRSVAAVPPGLAGPGDDPREAFEPTWSVGRAATPPASATVVELQRAPLETDSAPSATERWLRRPPVTIGRAGAGEPGFAGHQTGRRSRVGEPSMQSESGPVRSLPVARGWSPHDTGSAAVPLQLARPTGRVGSPVAGEDHVLQRAGSNPAEPAAAPPEPPAVDTSPAGGVPASAASAGALAAPHQVPESRDDLDRLAASLMPALLWRIKAELVTERERRGVRSDRF